MAKQKRPRMDTRMDRTGQQVRSRAGGPEPVRARAGGPEQLSRGQQRRRAIKRARRPWWRGPAPLVGTVVVVLALIGIFIAIALRGSSGASGPIGQPVAATIARAVTTVSPSVIAKVGTGNLLDPYRAISGPALHAHGRPQVLYIGGEFCPYCAADRWSLVNALSRFGTFSRLRYMRSAVTDQNLATFTFDGSRYTSSYVSFVPIENEDRNHNPLQSLTSEQQHLLSTLGGNGYPFVDIAGRYANDAPNAYPGGFDQSVLSGKDWSQIAGALSNAHDPITQGIIGNANYLTAAICTVTHHQPARACNTATILHIERLLPARH